VRRADEQREPGQGKPLSVYLVSTPGALRRATVIHCSVTVETGAQRPPRHPIGFDLEADVTVGAPMAVATKPMAKVVSDVARREPDDTMTAPLADVNQLVAKQVRGVLRRFAHRDQRPERDRVGTARHRPTDQQHVPVSPFDLHRARAAPRTTGS